MLFLENSVTLCRAILGISVTLSHAVLGNSVTLSHAVLGNSVTLSHCFGQFCHAVMLLWAILSR